jgi:glutaredoxin-related protein
MLKESPGFSFENINIPYLHFTGQQKEIYNVKRSTEFYDSIKSSIKYSEIIEAFAHHHFASSISIIPELVSNGGLESNITKSYLQLCNSILEFLNNYFNK